MVDYRRFLAQAEKEVLPYFGGRFVEAPRRRLRLEGREPLRPGWWSFAVRGRIARPSGAADPPDLSALPAAAGHALRCYVFLPGGRAERFALAPDDEPPLFAVVKGRRWSDADLVFDSLGFESGVEEEARQAFEEERSLSGLAAVPATLRAAFGFAVLEREARRRGTFVLPAEGGSELGRVADAGACAAREVLDRLVHERAVRRAAAGALTSRGGRPSRPGRAAGDPVERAAEALVGAGGRLLAARLLAGGLLEVRYSFLGERFESLVDAVTLQVYDAGICLAGSDGELTLESLPGAIREAYDIGVVHVTRHVD
ncbi:MAG TPA: hypothetical protein VMD59_05140 [Acidimicrobiales bacterium]|nr:hypothetical protein [Acidimicrobiales bacterium]